MKRSAGVPLPEIRVDRSLDISLERQIYSSLRQAIRCGILRAGARIPATRILARELGVARKSVVAAFRRLATEGFLHSRTGAGTFVAADKTAPQPDVHDGDATVSRHASLVLAAPAAGAGAMLDPSGTAADLFPRHVWARQLSARWRAIPAGPRREDELQGLLTLRTAIAEYIAPAREIACDPDEIVITSSRQRAMTAVLQALTDPGDSVIVEDPCDPTTPMLLRKLGATPRPAEVDGEGLRIESVSEVLDPRLAIVAASAHYPFGTAMSLGRRYQLCQWSKRLDVPIVELDHAWGLPSSRPRPALKAIDRQQRVVYVSSLSSFLIPGVDIGYVIAPRWLVPAVAHLAAADGVPSAFAQQAALADFIRQGDFARHVQTVTAACAERREALQTAVREQLSDEARAIVDTGLLHLIVWLADDIDDLAVEHAAARRGIAARALSSFATQCDLPTALVLGFGALPVESATDEVAILGEVIRGVRAAGTRRPFRTANELRPASRSSPPSSELLMEPRSATAS